MRPGRASDLPQLLELWQDEVREGRQDVVPSEARLRRSLENLDWESKSRIAEGADGRIIGSVLVTGRPTPEGLNTTLYVAGAPGALEELVRWGVQLSRATGATAAHLFRAKGRGKPLASVGMHIVRPWWRMDRSLLDTLPEVKPVGGYRLIDGLGAEAGSWGAAFNRSFGDHWRFSPHNEVGILSGRTPPLCLAALSSEDGTPAAITFGEVERYKDDPRPQPVGLVSHVGTVPEHRRRGLAIWLVAECLVRLRAAGARHVSLYVDGWNQTRAFDAYRKLGFEVVFETEVWEATFP